MTQKKWQMVSWHALRRLRAMVNRIDVPTRSQCALFMKVEHQFFKHSGYAGEWFEKMLEEYYSFDVERFLLYREV